MVVLAASLITSGANGKVLLARQFVDMPRIRVDGLLSAFPKLLGAGSKQHTFIETHAVRYIYQPIDGLYLVLLTTRSSNIVDDREALQLLGRCVRDVCPNPPIDSTVVAQKAFEILFAFDEVIALGAVESTTLEAVRTCLSMESGNETLQNMLHQKKLKKAEGILQDKEREFANQRKASGSNRIASVYAGVSSADAEGLDEMDVNQLESLAAASTAPAAPAPTPAALTPSSSAAAAPKPAMKLGGMRLGGATSTVDKMLRTGEVARSTATPAAAAAAAAAASGAAGVVGGADGGATEDVHVGLTETVSVRLTRDGGHEGLTVSGELSLTVGGAAQIGRVVLRAGDATKWGAFVFQPNPRMAKDAFAQSRTLMAPGQKFPAGGPRGLLRWRLKQADGGPVSVPLNLTVWPSGESVSLEAEAAEGLTLQNVVIAIPAAAVPESCSAAAGDISVNGGPSMRGTVLHLYVLRAGP